MAVYHVNPTAVTYNIVCERTETLMQQWQLDVYDALYQSYRNLKAVYDEQLAAARAATGGVRGSNPATNRRREKEELEAKIADLQKQMQEQTQKPVATAPQKSSAPQPRESGDTR